MVIPNVRGDIEITCDASNIGIGAVLTQGGHSVALFSRKLTPAEKNYAAHEKETLAVVEAMKQWRVYIDGCATIIYTDHRSLNNLKTQSNLNLRQRQWFKNIEEQILIFRYYL